MCVANSGLLLTLDSADPLLALLALLDGLVITLLYLGSMDVATIPGCGPAGATAAQLPDNCFGLAEGYPLRFLTAYQGIPEISQSALILDWAQWSLVSFSTLYLLWLPGRRSRQVPEQPSAAEQPAAV